MKKINIRRIATVFFTIGFILTLSATQLPAGQTSAEEVKSEVADAAEAIKEYTVEQRDQAIAKMESILKDLDDRIDKLENRIDENWDQMTSAARREARTTLRELRKQRNEVAEWYGGLKHSSADAWEKLKKGFSDAYDALADAWTQAEKEFDSGKNK